jgi:glycosyltransferase involved in cell wall biosynthesis
MPRFVGIKNNGICLVSDTKITQSSLEIVEVPSQLNSIPATQLITDYRYRDGSFFSKYSKKNRKDLKVAFIGNWKMKCGISTYSENLWGPVITQVGDYRLFIEKNDKPTGPLNIAGDLVLDNNKIIPCWSRGESLNDLVKEINKFSPDVVWIQHEFGLWSNARHWLSFMSRISDYRVIVTMHSVFHHQDKTIVEAAIPEIVVHLDGAADILKNEKMIPGIVHVIPHGCSPASNTNKLWNFYKSNHTFVQFGFGFRYKGWEIPIKAAAILKKKYDDVFFTGLFSESPFNKAEHQLYYNELTDLIKKLDVEENVAIIRSYQSDSTIDSYLRTNQVSVFFYVSNKEHEVFGASGAARMAMGKGIPVVTSSANHFSDLPTIKADSPEQIAEELDKLFQSDTLKQNQIEKQIDYINDHTWEKIAERYLILFENPCAS